MPKVWFWSPNRGWLEVDWGGERVPLNVIQEHAEYCRKPLFGQTFPTCIAVEKPLRLHP